MLPNNFLNELILKDIWREREKERGGGAVRDATIVCGLQTKLEKQFAHLTTDWLGLSYSVPELFSPCTCSLLLLLIIDIITFLSALTFFVLRAKSKETNIFKLFLSIFKSPLCYEKPASCRCTLSSSNSTLLSHSSSAPRAFPTPHPCTHHLMLWDYKKKITLICLPFLEQLQFNTSPVSCVSHVHTG